MTTVENLTQDDFERALDEPGIMVVDFWAAWCGPCRELAPQFRRAAELRPQYRFAKVEVDAEPALAGAYSVRAVPTLLVLRDGEPVATQPGGVDAGYMVRLLDRIAASAEDPASAVVAEAR
jgi:thioredoxin 1